MSVAKTGSDDHNCGLTNHDPMHRAICRLVASGVTVVAAAGNNRFSASRLVPASYNEVITVSALADSDGRPGRLRRQRVLLVGGYDRDDTFANFSNYGARRRPHRAGQVHLVERARRVRVPLGDLDGGAARDRRGRAVQGVAPACDAGPGQARARAAATTTGRPAPTPTGTHEPLLDVVAHRQRSATSRSWRAALDGSIGPAGGTRQDPGRGRARRGRRRRHQPLGQRGLPHGASLSDRALAGSSDTTSSLTLTVPGRHPERDLLVRRSPATIGGTSYDGPDPGRRRHHRPDASAGRPRRPRRNQPQRRRFAARARLAGRHRRHHRHRRLPGPMAGRRRAHGAR